MDIRHLLNGPVKEKYFNCEWKGCHKSFTRRSDLARHLRIHTGDKPYHCKWPTCGKQFIQRSALTVHYRTHTGEKPHVCEYEHCGKSFSDSSSLARHRRTHTGKRPYVCLFTDCGKSFTRKTTLVRHQRCHDPNWKSLNPDFQYMLTLAPNQVNNKNEMTCSVTKGSYSLPSPTGNTFNSKDILSTTTNFPQQRDKLTNTIINKSTSKYHHCNIPTSSETSNTTRSTTILENSVVVVHRKLLTL